MSALDWPALMQLGLRVLRLRPAEFWALTPAELRLMLGDEAQATAVLGRTRLDELLAAYPDRPPEGDGGENG